MSKYEFKLPDIGEGVSEGEIVSWLVAAGDAVSEDQDMVEVMTDKATVTIGAPQAGTVSEIRAAVGDTVPVGDVIVVLEGSSAAAASPAASPSAEPPQAEPRTPEAPAAAASAVGDIKESLPGMKTPGANVEPARSTPTSAVPAGDYFNEKPLAAPATRKFAREVGVDIRKVRPSGDKGRLTKEDIQAFASGGSRAAAATSPGMAVPAAAPVAAGELEERTPIRGMRKRIFENMARSKRTAAHFTYVDECECSKLIELRQRLKPIAAEQDVKLSFLPLIVKAVIAALKRTPVMNSLVDDSSQELVTRKNFDIGIAVATEGGLIVPVIRNADKLTVVEIGAEVARLAGEARLGKTRREDLGGSSFTITSLGRLGGYFATPVVNYPEVGILYIPEMKKRPVVVGDEIKIGHVMNLSLSFDHRIINGSDGAAFTKDIVSLLEDPDRLVLSM